LTASADVLVQRVLDKIDVLCAERDRERLKKDQLDHDKERVLGERRGDAPIPAVTPQVLN
jgi:hypothetical protein